MLGLGINEPSAHSDLTRLQIHFRIKCSSLYSYLVHFFVNDYPHDSTMPVFDTQIDQVLDDEGTCDWH
jgi:hypothetical protein